MTHTMGPEKFGMITGDDGAPHVGVGTGVPVMNHISNFFLTGISLELNDDIAGFDFDLLKKAALDFEIGVKVLYFIDVGDPEATDAVTFTVTYTQSDEGEVTALPVTALDTVITTDVPAVTSGYRLQKSPRGIIAANKFDDTAKDGTMAFMVTPSAITSYGAGEITFVGLQFDFRPHLLKSPGSTEVENEWDAGNIGWGA